MVNLGDLTQAQKRELAAVKSRGSTPVDSPRNGPLRRLVDLGLVEARPNRDKRPHSEDPIGYVQLTREGRALRKKMLEIRRAREAR